MMPKEEREAVIMMIHIRINYSIEYLEKLNEEQLLDLLDRALAV